jgi:hypothetical protein
MMPREEHQLLLVRSVEHLLQHQEELLALS